MQDLKVLVVVLSWGKSAEWEGRMKGRLSFHGVGEEAGGG